MTGAHAINDVQKQMEIWLDLIRGGVEKAESDRSISVHNRAEMGRRKFHIREFFGKWRARQDSNLRPPA
jgi:hypothetical protein